MTESRSMTEQDGMQHSNHIDVSSFAVDQCLVPHRTKETLTATPSCIMTSTTLMDVDTKDTPVKVEDLPSPSQSPTLVAEVAGPKCKVSRTPTPLPVESPMSEGCMTSKSSTPVTTQPKYPRKTGPAPVQLIADLSVAREEALASFHEIRDNSYQNKSLGRSRELLESMTCECTYEPGVDDEDSACGPYSDCINRLTQIECLPDDCRCGSACQNQRFQRKQYANIEIVLTEKKGYGLRAEENFHKDTFIFEYVGDVVSPSSFKRRMREYAEEGIRHFYFMMLQKDEFIDATKSGGLGRFANHSCNPNCYVAKWTIGKHVRMGIFAKRNVQKHEELTFNYNVDRYGHQAQECFCGEPNCLGFIGGKTQTDLATMDDLYLDALGITDEADLRELKGTKKKKGKKIDDPDFLPSLKTLSLSDVPKVIQAIRQTTSRKVLSKLLTRVKITEDELALRQLMRLRGYSVMTNVLEDHATDMDLIALAMESMTKWPLVNRNKVLDSKVHVLVESCVTMENGRVRDLAQKLLDHWNTLPVYNRIPKRQIEESDIPPPVTPVPELITTLSLPLIEKTVQDRDKDRRWEEPLRHLKKRRFLEIDFQEQRIKGDIQYQEAKKQKENLAAVIAEAAQAAAAEEVAAAAAVAAKAEAEARAVAKAAKRREMAARKSSMTPQQKEMLKEKRLLKLVGAVVVKCMSKYAKSLDRENFKKYARELTQVIAEKEKKSSSYRETRLDAFTEEKVVKIKKFSKDYIGKVLHKLEKSSKRPHRHSDLSSMANTPSTSTAVETPRSHEGDVDVNMFEDMTVEEAMGLDPDEQDADAEYSEEDGDENLREAEVGDQVCSPGIEGEAPPDGHLSGTNGEDIRDDVDMSMDDSASHRTAVPRPSSPLHSQSLNGIVDRSP